MLTVTRGLTVPQVRSDSPRYGTGSQADCLSLEPLAPAYLSGAPASGERAPGLRSGDGTDQGPAALIAGVEGERTAGK